MLKANANIANAVSFYSVVQARVDVLAPDGLVMTGENFRSVTVRVRVTVPEAPPTITGADDAMEESQEKIPTPPPEARKKSGRVSKVCSSSLP